MKLLKVHAECEDLKINPNNIDFRIWNNLLLEINKSYILRANSCYLVTRFHINIVTQLPRIPSLHHNRKICVRFIFSTPTSGAKLTALKIPWKYIRDYQYKNLFFNGSPWIVRLLYVVYHRGFVFQNRGVRNVRASGLVDLGNVTCGIITVYNGLPYVHTSARVYTVGYLYI